MPETYSPLRYPGGKAKLTNFLAQVLACNDIVEPCYIEPYAGGAGAALALLAEEYVDSIIINDADPRIYCFWKAVTEHNDDFLNLLSSTSITVSQWRRQRDIYDVCDAREVLRVGFATFFLNRTTRSGIVHNGGPIGGYDQAGNYKIDARFNRESLIRRVQRIGAYADRIMISAKDGLSLLKKINLSKGRARRCFVYLDPPYYVKGAELYLNRFTHPQHRTLARYLKSGKNFPWIMTYDNVEPIRALYSGFIQHSFDLSYSAYERRKGKELLIHPNNVRVPDSAYLALPMVA